MKAIGWVRAALAMALASAAIPAQAGIFSDDLTRCVVGAATEDDKNELMKWMFGAMSTNPAISRYSAVTDAQRTEFSRSFVTIMERLLLKDCRTQAVAAVKNEGMGVVEQAFQVLGEIAGRGLLTAPGAAKAMGEIEGFMDRPRWEAFGKEAGAATP